MSQNDITNILVCGIGGQGVMTAAEILAEAAMAEGHDVKKTEVAGMAQRGGVVTSHLRFGRKVLSPQIEPGTVQVLLGFEGAEALRWSHYLKPDGMALVISRLKADPKAKMYLQLSVSEWPGDEGETSLGGWISDSAEPFESPVSPSLICISLHLHTILKPLVA